MIIKKMYRFIYDMKTIEMSNKKSENYYRSIINLIGIRAS
jgi:hypothetical protein